MIGKIQCPSHTKPLLPLLLLPVGYVVSRGDNDKMRILAGILNFCRLTFGNEGSRIVNQHISY